MSERWPNVARPGPPVQPGLPSSSTAGEPMDPRSNKQLVMNAWEMFATRDPGRVRAVFAPDAEWLAPPGNATAPALDGTHPLIGRDRIVQFLTREFGIVFVAGVAIDFRGIYADGDTVIVEERMQATLAHGGRYDNDYCFIFELEDGLIKRVREYMDTHRGARLLETPSAV